MKAVGADLERARRFAFRHHLCTSMPRLPPELVDRIASLSSSDSLCSFARCSRQSWALAIPFLYEHVVLYVDEISAEHLRPVALLLLTRPEVARHVRALTLPDGFSAYNGAHGFSMFDGRALTTPELDSPFALAIRAYNLPEDEEAQWIRDADSPDSDDAILAFLIPALPNLRRLDTEDDEHSLYLPKSFKRATTGVEAQPHATLRLTDVLYRSGQERHGRMFECMAPLLSPLPSLRRLFAHRYGSDYLDPSRRLAALPVHSSQLVHIELKDCRLSDADISHVLRVPVALETFIYEIGCGHLSFCDLSITGLRSALDSQRMTLKDLWLDHFDDGALFMSYMYRDDMHMASLADFRALTRIRIAAVFVVNLDEFLPARDLLPFYHHASRFST